MNKRSQLRPTRRSAFAVLILAGIGFVTAWWFGLVSVPSQWGAPPLPDGERLRQDLASEGWSFQPVNLEGTAPEDRPLPPITRFQAIGLARQQLGSFDWRRGLTGTAANAGTLKSLEVDGVAASPAFAQPRLVWIVTFAGLEMESSGPPGSAHVSSNEWDVVLDAYSGEYLFGLNWTR